jgi:hypothetical protein
MSTADQLKTEKSERRLTAEARDLTDLEWCHEADREDEVFSVRRNPETFYEVIIESRVPFEQRRQETPPAMWELMEAEVAPIRGKKGFVLSSTIEGGGVAMQEPPALDLLNEMGADVTWLVSDNDPEAFITTKKMHNLQQDVLGAGETFTAEDKAKHKEYGLKNFRGMMENVPGFAEADFYWIEDPQLAAMIPELMKINPNATFIYRNHIQTDRDKMAEPGSPQNLIYEYLRDECAVGKVDAYVAHPVEQFVPYGTEHVVAMPPTSELHEDLNREVSEEEKQEKLQWLDGQVMKQNFLRRYANREQYMREHGEEPSDEEYYKDDQPLFDRSRKWLTGFARFDKAKGQEFNMRLQMLITDKLVSLDAPEELIPHTIITGNGATDDPDRNKVLAEMIELRNTRYADYAKYITVVGLEHDFTAVNVLLANSMYTENFSVAEGFEHRRTEGMLKGTPSLSSNAGGLPLQGKDGEGGFVADLERMDEELDRIANEVVADILDEARYAARREATLQWAEEFSKQELTTVANVTRFARIVNGKGDRKWKIGEMLKDREAEGRRYTQEMGARAAQ